MKKIIILCFLTFSLFVNAQGFRGLDKSPLDMVNFPASSQVQDKVLRILYSRPQLKSRNLKTLIPNGKLWRTGANESTEITFFKDVKIDSKVVSSGRYTLYTIPDETAWTIIINKKVNINNLSQELYWNAHGKNGWLQVISAIEIAAYDLISKSKKCKHCWNYEDNFRTNNILLMKLANRRQCESKQSHPAWLCFLAEHWWL